MLALTDIFEKIIDRFDDGTLTEKNFVSHVHEFVLHVFLELGDELNAVRVEFFKQRGRNIASVSKYFAKHFLGEFGDNSPVPVVNIAGSKAESDDFAFVVNGKMEFEAEEPAC